MRNRIQEKRDGEKNNKSGRGGHDGETASQPEGDP